jgi:hypothetical protein
MHSSTSYMPVVDVKEWVLLLLLLQQTVCHEMAVFCCWSSASHLQCTVDPVHRRHMTCPQ